MPMIANDIIEVARENPELLPLTIPLSIAGAGTQTYGPGEFGDPEIIGTGALIDPSQF